MNVKIAGGGEGIHANQGSCIALISYLQHEDLDRLKSGQSIEMFFDQIRDDIRGHEVINRIDQNKAQLGKTDAKFYSVIFSPSSKELEHISSGSPEEQSKKLKDYIRKEAMPEYAAGFNKGLKSDDILYFGKIHYDRGAKKENQLHIHLIVSRKDIANKKKLSPMTNHRSTEKGAIKGGFDRKNFVSGIESRFDKWAGYSRDVKESFAYCNAIKNGDLGDIKEQTGLRVAQDRKMQQGTYNEQKIEILNTPKQKEQDQSWDMGLSL